MPKPIKMWISQFRTPNLFTRIKPWSPADENPSFWFRMDQTTGSGNSLTLTDLSGNGHNAVLGPTALSAPTIVPNVLNGRPVLRLVASQRQSMQFGGTTTFMPVANPASVVIVTKASAALGTDVFQTMLAMVTGPGKYEGMSIGNSAGYSPFFWSGGDGVPGMPSVGIDGFDYSSEFFGFLLEFTGGSNFNNPSYWSAYKNNVPQSVTAGGIATTQDTMSLIGAWPSQGPGFFYDGDVAEVIFFPSMLDSTARNNLREYLNQLYGINVGGMIS